MAADIINTLNERGRSVRAGAKMAQPSDIQRIRNADLSRFTIDQLVRVAYRLGHKPEMKMTNVRTYAIPGDYPSICKWDAAEDMPRRLGSSG